MFGLKPLLGLEPMAPIRPQLLVSHANHSATETSIKKDVQWTDDIRGDQKPRGPPLTCLTLWANLALASMYLCMCVCMHVCVYVSMCVCRYVYMCGCVCMYVCMCVCMYVLMYDYIYVLFVCRGWLYIHRCKRTGTGD